MFAPRKLISLFALLDAKLTDSGKGNVYHGENIQIITYPDFFRAFYGSQGIAQNVEESKVDVFSITILIVIPAVQFLTQNIIKELQRRVQNTVEHLRRNFLTRRLHR